ncbi:hypothetical protein [Thermoflexibacter ruber]|uniref:Lipocalin-like domain-containing protein n=1 Tax=Thermoflexibacter ruber TaxID=1003 RepID=A0A1I2FMR5_9BACT|nr:hypothetical protein [Thermoflexibacter ruber]SFF06037.1 hypothetical protein SAMN04488541_101460 [Thermoflexibacter ruber]
MKFSSTILLALILIASGCNLVKIKPNNSDLSSIVGSWKENWGAGEQTNVNYSDEYVISTNQKGSLAILCPSRNNYFFEKISFYDKILKVKLIIKDLKYNAGDSWVAYELTLQDNNTLVGSALTKAGKKVKIVWERKK